MSDQSAASLEDYLQGKQVTPCVLAEDGLKWYHGEGVGASRSRHHPKVNCFHTFPHPHLPLSKTSLILPDTKSNFLFSLRILQSPTCLLPTIDVPGISMPQSVDRH